MSTYSNLHRGGVKSVSDDLERDEDGGWGVEVRLGQRGLLQRDVPQMRSHAEAFGIEKQLGRERQPHLDLTVFKITLMLVGGGARL